MRQLLFPFVALLLLLLDIQCRAEDYEVPFLNPGKRSFNRVVLRPMDFLQHKRMVSFGNDYSRSPLLNSLLNGRQY